jgi:hypothetical protein
MKYSDAERLITLKLGAWLDDMQEDAKALHGDPTVAISQREIRFFVRRLVYDLYLAGCFTLDSEAQPIRR